MRYLLRSSVTRISSFARALRANSSTVMENRRVFVARQIPEAAREVLTAGGLEVDTWEHDSQASRDDILARVKGVAGIFSIGPQPIDDGILERAGDSLRVVSQMAVGVDNVELAALRQRGVRLGHTPGVLTDACADTVVALTLCVTRRVVEMVDRARNGEWGDWEPFGSLGRGLRGSTVGIVGLGRIGVASAQRLAPLGVSRFIYTSRTEKPAAEQIRAERVTFETLLQSSDVVIACCSLNTSTQEMFDKAAFSQMKTSAVFINIGRGGLVQQDDLVQALSTNQIGAAGLDVTTPEPLPPTHPLFHLKNCVVLPHIGSAEEQTRTDMAVLAARNLLAGVNGGEMPAEYPLGC